MWLGFCLLQSWLKGALQYNQTLVIDHTDGLITVPAGKTWKIVNMRNTGGQITATGAVSGHCGTSCGGGVCSSSSCRYLAYLYDINGIGFNEAVGCFVCSGSTCTGGTGIAPNTYLQREYDGLPKHPFWLAAGNTFQVNVTNMLVSILEFNIVPLIVCVMKQGVMTLLLAVAILGLSLNGRAQGSLQFNQVKLVTSLETVPANKVWKVVSVVFDIGTTSSGAMSSTSSSCSSGTYYSRSIVVNGVNTKTGEECTPLPIPAFPTHMATPSFLWLPAGATLSGGPCNNQISVIEFNVVP